MRETWQGAKFTQLQVVQSVLLLAFFEPRRKMRAYDWLKSCHVAFTKDRFLVHNRSRNAILNELLPSWALLRVCDA